MTHLWHCSGAVPQASPIIQAPQSSERRTLFFNGLHVHELCNEVANRNDSDQLTIVAHYGQTGDVFGKHHSRRVGDGTLWTDSHRLAGHDLMHALFERAGILKTFQKRIAYERTDRLQNVTVGDHANDTSVLQDDHMVKVFAFEEACGCAQGIVRV